MQILIDPGDHNLRNKGNVSLLQIAVQRLHNLWPNALIGVVTQAPMVLQLYCPQAVPARAGATSGWANQPSNGIRSFVPSLVSRLMLELREEIMYRKYITSAISGGQQQATTLEGDGERLPVATGDGVVVALPAVRIGTPVPEADLVVAGGGGIVCDVAKPMALPVLDRLEAALENGVPSVMVGQQIGPLHDPELRARARAVLPAVDLIAIREQQTALPLLESLGVNMDRVVMTGDDALELAYAARPAKLGTSIGVGMRVQWYTAIDLEHLETVRGVLQRAAARNGAPLISVPISYSFHEEDAQVIRHHLLNGYAKTIDVGRWRFADPMKTIRATARCRIMISGAFHPAVYALAQGIPVIGLAKSATYRDKLVGLAHEFGSGCEVLMLDDPELAMKLETAIDRLWQSAEALRGPLLAAAARQVQWGQAAYQRIYDLVEARKDGNATPQMYDEKRLYATAES
jgi:colanic acid/amylovoran biosynthesis protein